MRSNEFVKNFGIHEAKIALLYCKSTSCGTVFYKNIQVDAEDLKRLVKSHELVEFYNGLDKAKKKLSTEQGEPYYNYSQQLVDSLKQAIADVESCM